MLMVSTKLDKAQLIVGHDCGDSGLFRISF